MLVAELRVRYADLPILLASAADEAGLTRRDTADRDPGDVQALQRGAAFRDVAPDRRTQRPRGQLKTHASRQAPLARSPVADLGKAEAVAEIDGMDEQGVGVVGGELGD